MIMLTTRVPISAANENLPGGCAQERRTICPVPM